MDRLQTVRVFVNVVEHGGFARAGLVMNMANAVVSRHIADLESHLGAGLLNRTTRRLFPCRDRAELSRQGAPDPGNVRRGRWGRRRRCQAGARHAAHFCRPVSARRNWDAPRPTTCVASRTSRSRSRCRTGRSTSCSTVTTSASSMASATSWSSVWWANTCIGSTALCDGTGLSCHTGAGCHGRVPTRIDVRRPRFE